ncbi:MAG: hypothetical protein ACPIB0_00585 [Akkermansiaceae bacterium]
MRSSRPSSAGRQRRVRSRNSRRSGRPTLREAFQGANLRAKQRANRRMGRRLGLTSVQAAIADTAGHDMIHLNIGQRMVRWFIALMILPFCISITWALFSVSAEPLFRASADTTATYWGHLSGHWAALSANWLDLRLWGDFLSAAITNASVNFLYFGIGFLLMVGWFFTGLLERLFLYFYVLGHELTHALFVYACGGKVGGIHVTADGGYVMTNKSNALIALSPYFLPFWSAVILALSSVIGVFYNHPYEDHAIYFLVGFSWAFHLLWTLWMIPRDQPDLKENGIVFSLAIIYLANAIVISLLLCLASEDIGFKNLGMALLETSFNMVNFAINAVN